MPSRSFMYLHGKELEVHNAAVRAKNPKVCRMLEWVYCCYCVHRGKYRGCEFGQVPLTIDNKACPLFRPWGSWKLRDLEEDANKEIKSGGKNG